MTRARLILCNGAFSLAPLVRASVARVASGAQVDWLLSPLPSRRLDFSGDTALVGEVDGPAPKISDSDQVMLLWRAGGEIVRAEYRGPVGWKPLDELVIRGAAGNHIDLRGFGQLPVIPQRFDRLAGAIGESTLQRLRQLEVVLLGAGRLGSLMADTLSRAGVKKLAVVDADMLETHTLDASAHLQDFVGRPKAVALAAVANGNGVAAQAHCVSGNSVSAVAAVRSADLLITAVDEDSARLWGAILSQCYLLPHLDVAASVMTAADRTRLHADVRLTVPGHACLLCYGGFETPTADLITHLFDASPADDARPWAASRAGSARSINLAATALGQRAIERLLSGTGNSLWQRLDLTDGLSAETIQPDRRLACPVCRLAGCGDGWRERLPALRAELLAPANFFS